MIKNLLNLLFPLACYSCNNILIDNEKDICTTCRHNLPVTNYHYNNSNTVKKVFYGRVKIEHATALFRFQKKGITQRLIHNLKYKGYEKIGVILGDWLGSELKTIDAYKDIDIVIPVPLHKNKFKKRGYNQVSKFGINIANALNTQYNDSILIKTTATTTQVFKTRVSRWGNASETFTIQNQVLIKGKHILLVDDIITTGATIEACAEVLNQVSDVKISVATMAIVE